MKIAEVERTVAGPKLKICGVEVYWWLGTVNDSHVAKLADEVNAAYASRHQDTHQRAEVMNSPESAARGSEARDLISAHSKAGELAGPVAPPAVSGSWVTPRQFAAEAAKRFACGTQIEQAIVDTFEYFGNRGS